MQRNSTIGELMERKRIQDGAKEYQGHTYMELDDFRKSSLLQSSRGSYTSPALALPATPLWTCRRGTIASNHSPTTSEYPSPDRAEKYRSFFVPSKGGSTKDARTTFGNPHRPAKQG